MITLLLGRSGSGKTGKIINSIGENARRGEKGQLLIVPPQFTHETERRLCQRGGDSICLSAEVLSFERLGQRVFSQVGGGGRQLLDLPGRLLIMRLAIKSVEGSLQVYSGLSRPHALQSALEMVEELESCAVTPADLERAGAEAGGSLGKKLNDAALILAAYDALLSTGLSDRLHDMARLCRALECSDFAAGKKIYADGFGWFTALEQECLYQLVRGGAELTVSVTWDEDDEAFMLQRRALGAVRRIAQRAGKKVRTIWCEKTGNKPESLEFIEENFFAGEVKKFGGKCDNIRLYLAEDPFAECRLAAARAVELVRKEGLR